MTFVCWRWKPFNGYRSTYPPATVRALRNMIKRHYPKEHRFVCVTDTPEDIDADIETIPLWDDFANIPSPHGGNNPSCYRRLRMFAPNAAEWFGPRFVSMDLDAVIVNDISPIVDRPEDAVFWGDTNRNTHYNGSLVLLTAGARPQVWTEFKPKESPQEAKAKGFFGSDQAWVSFILGTGEARWTRKDGVYSFRNDVQPNAGKLPADARIVMFHGAQDPWGQYAQQLPWVRSHYLV